MHCPTPTPSPFAAPLSCHFPIRQYQSLSILHYVLPIDIISSEYLLRRVSRGLACKANRAIFGESRAALIKWDRRLLGTHPITC